MSNETTAAQLLKRPNEENQIDSVEKLTKRVKTDDEHTEDAKRIPKKKVVLLLAYSGKGYFGMQVCLCLFILILPKF